MHNDLYFLCRKVCGWTEARLCSLFEECGLTFAQGGIAVFVLRAGDKGTTLTELCKETGITMSALSPSVHAVWDKGFVRVTPSKRDSRKKIIVATEKLKALSEQLREIEADSHRLFCGKVGEERLRSVCETLAEIVSVQHDA